MTNGAQAWNRPFQYLNNNYMTCAVYGNEAKRPSNIGCKSV